MSPTDPPPSSVVAARRRAILLVLGASAAFVVSAALVKAIGPGVPLPQVILFRNAFALPLLLLMVMQAGGLAMLRTRLPWRHAERTFWGLCGMTGAFHGFAHLPLATATALGFTMPLFLTALSVLLLGEKVGWRRWSAVAVGFCGVLVMVRPGFGGAALPVFSVGLVLLGAFGWAMAMLSIRRMGEAGESGVSIVFWFALSSAMVAGLATIPVWVTPTPAQWLMLGGIGFVSAIAQLLMTAAYRRGETTLLAPFEYSGLIWTMLVGILIWAEWPDLFELLGFAVLVGAGLYIWRREVLRAAQR
ncbi:DMT family transporter [Falsiroseomonas selenitidurans]|uniref:DMT family transporter n=1 Tax=Falsiroseomonas selenitidurans TaxID=2716335 RepID=A0ABX1E2C9_9PROT|nr:DMT family transporter [Falsiroseomonas selenitidurans]NKC31322.1 DMT family transporter [Falsiroseomonas selenitidurans]